MVLRAGAEEHVGHGLGVLERGAVGAGVDLVGVDRGEDRAAQRFVGEERVVEVRVDVGPAGLRRDAVLQFGVGGEVAGGEEPDRRVEPLG
ncbi:hypothetical protein ADL26_02760, partial [Thermoactinomyces vulgaris]